MIRVWVTEEMKNEAQAQIEVFKNSPNGKWRYKGVKAWRGVVCELITSRWLTDNYNVQKEAEGIDDSGIFDLCDMVIDDKMVELKSATEAGYRYIMPKVYNVINRPKDIYIASRYNDRTEQHLVEIMGFCTSAFVRSCPEGKNKGAAYYQVPLIELNSIHNLPFERKL